MSDDFAIVWNAKGIFTMGVDPGVTTAGTGTSAVFIAGNPHPYGTVFAHDDLVLCKHMQVTDEKLLCLNHGTIEDAAAIFCAPGWKVVSDE